MTYREQLTQSVKRLTEDSLPDDAGEEALYEMVDIATESAERALVRVLTMAPPPEPIACKAGCPWCCAMKVAVTPPEALRIARHLRNTRSEEELTLLSAKISATANITRRLTWQQHLAGQLMCPLNVDGSCSVRAVRPLACRSHNSLDVGRCKTYHGRFLDSTIPLYKPQQDIGAGIAEGIKAGCNATGRHGAFVELNEGLQIALSKPDAAKRWLAGEDVFETVLAPQSNPTAP